MGKGGDSKLPASRIRTIMKSSPNVEQISQEALHLMCRSAEMFVKHMAKESFKISKSKNKLDYDAIASYTQDNSYLSFTAEILPHKMTVKECLEWINKNDEISKNTDD